MQNYNMTEEWWIFVLAVLLLIGGIEKNPGPRKKRVSLTGKKAKAKRHFKYISNIQLSVELDVSCTKDDSSEQSSVKDTENRSSKKRKSCKNYNDSSNKKICVCNDQVASKTSRIRKKHLTTKIARQTRRAVYVNKLNQMTADELQRFKSRNASNAKKWKELHRQQWRAYDSKRKMLLRSVENEPTVDQSLQQPNSHQQKLKKLSLPKTYRKLENARQRSRKKLLRLDPHFRIDENKKQQLLKKILRSDPVYKQKENKNQEQLKRLLRSNSDYRKKDNAKQQSLKQLLRQNPVYKQKENKNQEELKKSLRLNDSYRKTENENKTQSRRKQSLKKEELEKDIDHVKYKFQQIIQTGPVYVCSCCKRMLYRHSVVHVPADKYKRNKVNRTLVNNCLSGYRSMDNSEWICKTCHNTIKQGRMPAQCEANQLYVQDLPFELSDLCPLEERLICLRIPFMQIINLPRGGQKGIKGPAVNVPTCLDSVINLLPRLPSQSQLVPIKLKRKLVYKGHVLYQSIRPDHVMNALAYLKRKHLKYKDVDINEAWMQQCIQEDLELASCLIEGCDDDDDDDGDGDKNGDDDDDDDDNNDETDDDETDALKGIPYNTCLQPSSQVYTGKEIISIAPGEGKHPISFFTDTECETLAFPTLLPTGQFGLKCNRQVNLSMKRYFNQRMLNVDARFAQNIDYLFFAQYMCEAKQILDNINIAMRKGSNCGKKLTAGHFLENMELSLSQNEGFRFLQNVRGSYPYWLKTLYDLNAMVRQLDIPTWFCSFSCADLKWPETIKIIAKQQGVNLSNEDVIKLDWQQRCLWIRSNPVTAARHFEFKVTKFLHDVLRSAAEPLGKITDYFIRTEFQQRGSPHIHCLFWIHNAPKIGEQSNEEVCKFIDRYVSAVLPNSETDESLYELVTTLQKHSHSSTCKKTSKVCRFNFPKPPTNSTLIAAPLSIDEIDPATIVQRKRGNALILRIIQDALIENPDRSLNDILNQTHVPEDLYIQALKESTNNTTIIYRRSPADTSINNYNPNLMEIWQANHDIQYVTNAYACAMYILSYVSKGEKQMGELLKKAAKECQKNDSIRNQLKVLGNVFLTHRELSAQEAAYRLLSIPLKHCSRSVEFVNSGLPEERIHILKPVKKLYSMDESSEDIFQKNMIDRYEARPDILEQMCLVEFATTYRLKGNYGSEKTDSDGDDEMNDENDRNSILKGKEIKLKKDMGIMVKRKVEAILRSPRFSSVKSIERYSHSQLMLFYPWRIEVKDLHGSFKTYHEFLQTVTETVNSNRLRFEKNSEALDLGLQNAEAYPEHEWNKLAAADEQEKYDDIEKKSCDQMYNEVLEDLPVLPEMSTSRQQFSIELQTKQMSDDCYYSSVRSLNQRQRELFDIILKWSRELVHCKKKGIHHPPFYTFLSGGAGTGKSHLIRTLVNMLHRELRPICESPDNASVILTAPTGIAAINIDGTTVHSMFSIPVSNNDQNYTSLSHEKLASFRRAFEDVHVIIIDEISMVGLSLLTSVHKRLQEIRGVTDQDVMFGGISILAVGDFYQIDPVKQKALFSSPSDPYLSLNPYHLWKDVFKLFELTEVMRQNEDKQFASLLNRIRIGVVLPEDVETLKSRIVQDNDKDYPHDALHVFSENILVDDHNSKMLGKLKGKEFKLEAIDSQKRPPDKQSKCQ